MLHKRSIAGFAFPQSRFRVLSLRGIAKAHDVDVGTVDLGLADRELGRKTAAVGVQCNGFLGSEVRLRVIEAGRHLVQRCRQRLTLRQFRQQEGQAPADEILLAVPVYLLASAIDGSDMAGLAHRDDGVLDVVEDGLQLACCAFADFARERGRLFGHQLHGAHDAAALLVHVDVRFCNQGKQPIGVEPPVGGGRFVDLLLELAMHGGEGLLALPAIRE